MFKPKFSISSTTYERWLFRMFRKAKNISNSEETLAPIPDSYKTAFRKWIGFYQNSMKHYVNELEKRYPEIFYKGPILEVGKGGSTSLTYLLKQKTNMTVTALTPFSSSFSNKHNSVQLSNLEHVKEALDNHEVIFFQIPFFQKIEGLSTDSIETIILKEAIKLEKDIMLGFHGLRMDVNGYRLQKEMDMILEFIKKEIPDIEINQSTLSLFGEYYVQFIYLQNYQYEKDDDAFTQNKKTK